MYDAKLDWVNAVSPNDPNPNAIPKASDFIRIEQGIKDAELGNNLYFTATNSGNDYTINPGGDTPNAPIEGVPYRIKVNANSTGAVRVRCGSGTYINVKYANGDIVTEWYEDAIYIIMYNGTDFLADSSSGIKINGQSVISATYTGAISKGDMVYGNIVMSKLADPASLPTGNANAVAFSPDGIYLAVSHSSSPYISIYKRSGDTFTKLANPTTLPTTILTDLSFSPDGIYLACSTGNSPYMIVYKRTGDDFAKLTDPSTLPGGPANAIKFSSDGIYVAIANGGTGYMSIYKRTGDTFTKLTNPTTIPTGISYAVAFSSDVTYLTVGHSSYPYISIYKRSGDTFTKLADPTTLPTDTAEDVVFSPDNIHMLVVSTQSPYIAFYKRNSDTFTKLSNPVIMPTSVGFMRSIGINSGGTLVAMASESSPYLTLYKRVGDTFFKLDAPPALPPNSAYSLSFSSNGYLAIAHNASPYVTIYKIPGTYTVTKADSSSSKIAFAAILGYAKEAGVLNDVKQVVKIWG